MNRSTVAIVLAALPMLVMPGAAQAASSGWETVEGGRVRLVVADTAEANGTQRAALQIELEPGWKTYWRDPGEAGIPPSLVAAPGSGFAVAAIDFPAPEWFDDGYSTWAGYKRSLALPVSLERRADGAERVVADAFLGICETICIPVQARFDVVLDPTAGSSRDDRIVAEAFAALPARADAGFGVVAAERDGQGLTVTTKAPGDGDASLFIAAAGGYAFGHTEPAAGPGRFSAKILSVPKHAARPTPIPYTLVQDGRAVAGTFVLE